MQQMFSRAYCPNIYFDLGLSSRLMQKCRRYYATIRLALRMSRVTDLHVEQCPRAIVFCVFDPQWAIYYQKICCQVQLFSCQGSFFKYDDKILPIIYHLPLVDIGEGIHIVEISSTAYLPRLVNVTVNDPLKKIYIHTLSPKID